MVRVLIIDDEETIRTILREALEHEGYEVFEAPDGELGIQIYRKQPADVVITDIFMPKMNGLGVIWELNHNFPDAKIIAISGGSTFIRKEASLSAAKQFNACRTVAKPFEVSEMIECVEELVAPPI